jgi:CRP/FNR family transcriptional regulator, nitrogen oxide reductase regulator
MSASNRSSPENLGYLQDLELFRGLEETHLEQVVAAGATQRIAEDSFLYFQGDPAAHIYVLLEGRLKLSQVTPDGQQIILRYASPGEALGVVALLAEMDYPVSSQAAEDSLVLGWDRASLTRLMEAQPRLALNAVQIMASRTREFQDRVRELSTEKVERRIARTLLRLVRQAGRKVEGGVLIDLHLSRQDLAEMTGTTLYTVSRTLSSWEARGLIKAGREKVVILFPHGLVAIAEDLPET